MKIRLIIIYIEKVIDIFINGKYDKQFSKKILSGKEYTITNLIPNLKNEDNQQVNDEITSQLFEVFKKYV